MSKGWKDSVARRPLLAAIGALVGIGVAGGALYEASGVLGIGRKSGAYEDLLAGLQDREDAAKVGQAVLTGDPHFHTGHAARALRVRIGKKTLSEVLAQDAVQGRIVETQGWVLPEAFTQLCALAAEAS
ncbi:MAG TPA: hypothetical protein VID67_08570 [Rhizomicrobium sp.]|jgi:hypothetical protein